MLKHDLAAGGEEVTEQQRSGVSEDAAGDFDAVVQGVVIEDGELGSDGAAFGIVGAVDEALDAGLDDGAGAHGAGFDGDVQRCAEQAVIAEAERRFAKRNDFCVGSRVGIRNGAIAGPGKDVAARDHNRANWDFAACGSVAGLVERGLHEGDVRWWRLSHVGSEWSLAKDSTIEL